MLTIFSWISVILASVVTIPVAVLFMEVIAARMLSPRARRGLLDGEMRPRVAVLVPANDESAGLFRPFEISAHSFTPVTG